MPLRVREGKGLSFRLAVTRGRAANVLLERGFGDPL